MSDFLSAITSGQARPEKLSWGMHTRSPSLCSIAFALLGLVSACTRAHGAVENWSLILHDAFGEGRDINLHIAPGKDGVEGAFGDAPRFNKMPHVVDASQVRLQGDRLTGSVRITIPFDGWVPADGRPLELKVTLNAVAGEKAFKGTYDLDTVNTEPEKPLPPFATEQSKSKGTPSPGPTVTGGTLSGSRAAPTQPEQVCRLTLNCRSIVRKSARDRKGQGIGVVLSFKGGRSFAARMVPQGSMTDVAFTATAEEHNLKFDGQRLDGTLTALVYLNEKIDEATRYDLAFDGLVIGTVANGTIKVVKDGEPLGDEVFQGDVAVGAPDPADALYRMTLHKAIPKHNHLNVLFTIRDGAILGGFAVSPHFNNSIHAVDFSGLRLDSGRVVGALSVTIIPDNWVPLDHQPVSCRYELDAKVVDGELMGKFTGTFGDTAVTGFVEGSTDRKEKLEQISGMTLKVENGVFGRAFLSVRYEDGKFAGGHIWNNHDRALKGTVREATLDWSNERIRGTLTLDSGHGDGNLPVYTCKVEGILVGNVGAGSADTSAADDGRQRMSTFWVAISPAKK